MIERYKLTLHLVICGLELIYLKSSKIPVLSFWTTVVETRLKKQWTNMIYFRLLYNILPNSILGNLFFVANHSYRYHPKTHHMVFHQALDQTGSVMGFCSHQPYHTIFHTALFRLQVNYTLYKTLFSVE